ncbi:MAG: HAD-IA family hydrolase [Xanthomonadales bacterium]|nr:HAD-IA family hydrolase [Xanthomonadales bacterium]
MSIRAITLDLDDTLWPIWPVIDRAEQVLHAWLQDFAPRTAQRYPVDALRLLHRGVMEQHPELNHDVIQQRRLSLTRALRESDEDEALAEAALDVFSVERNIVDVFPDTVEALDWLAQRFPIAALTNGSADLDRIGIGEHFVFQLGAREHGAAKPEPSIFHAACERLGVTASQVLHVGDDPMMDVMGAHRVGMRTAWINRHAARWPHAPVQPDYNVRDLAELATRLGRKPTQI